MLTPLAFAALTLVAPLQQQVPTVGEVRGLVRSEATGERLPYTVVEIVGVEGAVVALADSAGGYVLRNVPPGRRILRASRFDHAPLEIEVLVSSNRSVMLDLLLVQRPVALPGITALVRHRPRLSDAHNPSEPELSIAATRALEATPGVAEIGLGRINPGPTGGQDPTNPSDVLYVRGAPADLKLVLIDGAPVYAPFHLGGLIQPFDPELLHSAELYLGGAPARYDGGLSYVLGLRTRAGQRTELRSSGSVDLVSSRMVVDGPLTRNAGFLLGGRMVHPNGTRWLLESGLPYRYADLVGRIDADLGENHGVALTGFWNHEAVDWSLAMPDESANWGNAAASLRYRGSVLGGEAELLAAYGEYSARLPYRGSLADARARRMRMAADHTRDGGAARFNYGLSFERIALDYSVRPALRSADAMLLETSAEGQVAGAYLEADWQPAERWRIRSGGRVDVYSTDGVPRGAPRLSVTWMASDRASLTLAAGRYRQFIRASEPYGADSTFASVYVPPPLTLAGASHLLLALDQDLGEGLRLGIEGFYKDFDDLPQETSPMAKGGDQGMTTAGARASGVDLWVRRGEGSVTGWLGYSLSWVWSDMGREGGDSFSGRQLLSIGLKGPIGERGQFGVRVAYGAGLPYTAIPQVDFVAERPFSSPDSPRLSNGMDLMSVAIEAPPYAASRPEEPYLRLDLEVSHPWTMEWGSREVVFSPYLKVLNALDRRDALFYHAPGDGSEPDPLASLPLLPILGFRWTF